MEIPWIENGRADKHNNADAANFLYVDNRSHLLGDPSFFEVTRRTRVQRDRH